MITVTGSLAFDHIMDFPGRFSDHIMPDKIHQINLSFLVNTLKKQQGGTAGNIAYSLALIKTPVSIFATAGEDFNEYSKFLEDSGVDVSKIKIIEGEFTSSAFIMTDLSDNQITAFYPGAMTQNSSLTLSPSRGESSLNSRVSPPGRWLTDLVVISPNDPRAMVKFTKECQDSNIPYMLDPGMQLPALDSRDLKNMINGATILIGNDYEIELLTVKCKVKSEKLLEKVKILITTLGEKGSVIQTAGNTILTPGESSSTLLGTGKPTPEVSLPGRWQIEPGKPNEVLDPTGAGDAFRAGFLAGFIKGFNLKTCGQMGSVAACYAIEKYGTTSHRFTVEEFCERYEENFGEKLELSS